MFLIAHRKLIIVVLIAIFSASLAGCVKNPRIESAATIFPPLQTAQVSASANLININTASDEELQKLPGIGLGLAARIVEHRTRFGRFRRIEHLMLVRGINQRRFRALQPFVSIQ